jgi:hypothetical protein
LVKHRNVGERRVYGTRLALHLPCGLAAIIAENCLKNYRRPRTEQGNRIKIITIKLPFKSLLFPSLMFKTSGKTR